MNTVDGTYDLDMTRIGDGELVVLAEECQFLPARDELLVRFRELSSRVVCCRAKGRGLRRVDIEDAQQDAVFWLVEAIECYDTRQLGIRCGCTFRTFFFCVLTARFLDFVKHLACQKRRCGQLVSGEDRIAAIGCHRKWRSSNSRRLERHERVSCMDGAVDSLDATGRDLWEKLACGHTLHQIAAETDVGYETLKYRKRKLLTMLHVRVHRAVRLWLGESP